MLLSRDSTPLSHGNDESLFQDANALDPQNTERNTRGRLASGQ